MAFKFEIADDFRTEEAVHIAGGGDFKAGPEFLGNDAAANQLALTLLAISFLLLALVYGLNRRVGVRWLTN